MKKIIKPLLLSFSLLLTTMLFAGELQPITGILRTTTGSPVVITDTVVIQTTVAGSSADYNIKNIISLNFDQNTDTFLISPTTVRTKLTIYRYNGAGTLISPTRTEYLNVTYDNRYNKQTIDKASLKLENGYKVKVVLDSVFINGVSVDTLPRFVYVESEIHMTRYYQYTGGAVTLSGKDSLNTDCDAGNIIDELRINWGTVTGAEEYQLEWTFVNNYGPDSGTYYSASSLYADFKNNSTRITTTATNYRIGLIYEKGYVAWRVRAVGRNYLDPDKYIYGSWSSSDLVAISSLSTTAKYYNWREHEKSKNWQYSSTFAEEGKKKEVISYFDGSLHNRQSVTKVNSDKNVIVGETIYDFQGRPAVNVLPTPVNFPACTTSYNEPALKYYPKFNIVANDTSYSKLNFDMDAGGQCEVAAVEMDTLSGSSQYYSGNNPDQSSQQAFIPDAKGYPFSQVEYTPDNTGRIRSQSGVGEEFQLGSGHETKYLYGWPNQVELDRLFGSEAGDASHYKKNVVFDANGQASISYLNQEGKTIATALAGYGPSDTTGVYLHPLTSASTATDTLTIDLFNKDANGNSLVNKITPLRDGLEFSSQLTVAYTSDYIFTYELTVDSLADSCLIEDICISCIYDLEIKVTDECGVNLLGTDSIHRMIGHLDSIPNGFTMVCDSLTTISENDSVLVSLVPGVYTVSKVLTINSAARDFYVASYLDTTFNSCARTLAEFTEEALNNLDTSGCYITCDDCIAALGTKDDFVSAGRGTEVQYDLFYEQCLAPCKDRTLCDNAYEMMLIDVSPGGQYGKFNAATSSASGYGLSVFNPSNSLNPTVGTSDQGSWKHPHLYLNGTQYYIYMDDNGERTKIYVTPDGSGNYTPPVDAPSLVHTEATTGLQYTYPENLNSLGDFLPIWNSNFARSLVQFHPEYAYYAACKEHAIKYSGDTHSTDQFDSLLIATNSFSEALTNGFIKATYDSLTIPANDKVYDLFTNSISHAYDPFFSNSAYGLTFPIPGGSTTLAHSYLVSQMQDRYNNYVTTADSTYSMIEVAAILARCGNNFFSNPTAACLAFGTDFYGSSFVQANDSVRDLEWEFLKNFYLSEKRKLQFHRMDFYARNYNWSDPVWRGGCNACIGNSGYNFYSAGMAWPSVMGYPSSPMYNHRQPCGIYTYGLYSNVQKRFYSPSNTGLSAGNVPYQIYQQTGQCPMAYLLQGFLSGMAQDSILTADSVNLNTVSAFAPDLYNALNGGTPPSTFINFKWKKISIAGDSIIVHIEDPNTNTNVCTTTLNISSTTIASFDEITAIRNLTFDHIAGGMYYFNAVAEYTDSIAKTANITGSTCINIKDCNFEPACSANQFAVDVFNLTNMMIYKGMLSNTNYNISTDTVISPLISSTIKNTLGAPYSTSMMWDYVSPNKIDLYDNTDTTTKIRLTFLSILPYYSLTDVAAFVNVRSNYNNLFKAEAMDTSGVVVGILEGKAELITASGTSGLSMGECGFPPPVDCSTQEHEVRNDLEKVINEFLTAKPFINVIDLYTQANFTSLLESYMVNDLTTTSTVVGFDSTAQVITFSFNYTSDCVFKMYHDTTGTGMVFDSLIAVTNLTGVEPIDADGSYRDFYFIALYDNNGSTLTDTVRGTSCWPIKNCTVCDDSTTVSPVAIDSTTINIPFIYGGWNSGNPFPPIDTADCYGLYNQLLVGITAYNNSLYADLHNDTLTPGSYSTLTQYYEQVPNCYCGEYYYGYLYDYITADSSSTLPLPQRVDDFTPCTPRTACDSLYLAYTTVITDYNNFVTTDTALNYPLLDTTYSKNDFNQKYCNCAKKFIAGLTSVINGYHPDSTVVAGMIDLPNSCATAPCIPGAPDTAFVFPPMTYSVDPCVQQAINLAIQNAQNEYNQYLDSITTSIASRYTEHCLSALENFNYTYTDKEYHYTLYYYDQAGNLVKTIPPEGVERLDIDSYTDSLSVLINSDRTNNQQNVYTSHRMATNYEYNSLNQLVYQDMPDHDKMELVDFLLPNGLDSRLRIRRTQFVNANKGYLCGHLIDGSTITHGYVYTTNNGGNNWTRVNNTVAADINDIYFVNSTNGFAAANGGVVLKTTDGGSSWSTKNLYTTFLYTANLNAVYFGTTSSGVVAGSKDASNAGIYYTVDGGLSYSAGSGLATGDTVTGITYDGSNYFASVKNNGEGKIYKSSDSYTWTEVSQKRAGDLKKIQYLQTPSGIVGVAVGVDGTLLKTAVNSNSAWYVKATGTASAFRDIYFKNLNDGLAIIDSSSNKGQIWKTFDGGNSWELLSIPGDYYTSFQSYDSTKLMASGENGLLAKVLINSSPFGITKLSKPSYVNDLAHSDAVYYSGSPQTIAVGSNDTIYYTENANASSLSWTKIKTTSFGVSGGDANFKKVAVKDTIGNTLKGVVLTQNGKLYSFYKNSSNVFSFTIATIQDLSSTPISSYFFNDLILDNRTSTKFYAFDTISKRAFTGTITTTSTPTVTFTYMDTVTTQHKGVRSIAVNSSATDFLMVGDKGIVKYKASPNSTTTNYSNRTYSAKPLPLNDIAMLYMDEIYAVGDDGTMWTNFYGNIWKLLSTGESEKINKIAIENAGTHAAIACDNGMLYKLTTSDSANVSLLAIDIGKTDNLTALAMSDSNTYVGTSVGTVIHVPDITSSAYENTAIAGMNGSFNSMCFNPSSAVVLTGGEGSAMYQCLGSSSARMTDLYFSNPVAGISFTNATNGYLVTTVGDIRHTIDGGYSWTVIAPTTIALNNVYAVQEDQAIVMGTNKYFGIINGNASPITDTVTGGAGSVSLTNIDFNRNKDYGIMVGSSRSVYSVVPNGSDFLITYLSQPALDAGNNYNLQAVKVFRDNSFLIGGSRTQIHYYKGGSYSAQNNYSIASASTKVVADFCFLDDRTGYAVGNKGIALKCVLTGNIMDSGYGDVAGSIAWDSIRLSDPFGLYNSGTASTIDIVSVDFVDRHHGFFAGQINTFPTDARYAMLVDDQSDYYSTRFWYDKLGRMVLSQNTKQFNRSFKAYSFTKYDALGRIFEVGEKTENTSGTTFRKIFGDYVNTFYNVNTINNDSITSWLAGNGSRKEVTHTYYDTVTFNSLPITQENLRKRVSSVTYEDVDDGADSTYQHGTHYTYDIHGNVSTLLQDNPEISVSGQQYKQIDYEYDLISGKVNKVIYQPDAPDLLVHKYTYDADNRITKVETSSDNILWDLDAKYFYYAHGPLARTEYGKNQVHGMDYAYTLQGWIKGVNSNTLDSKRDMGQDSDTASANPNKYFARDAMGYTLGYFDNDYKAINGLKWNTVTNRFEAQTTGAEFLDERYELFNGNISHMTTAIVETDTTAAGIADVQIPKPLANAYQYDQLNRIKKALSFNNIHIPNNLWQATGQTVSNMYENTFAYDANGNILSQNKFDDAGVKFENMDYQYKKDVTGNFIQNRLYHVNDSASSGLRSDDIDDQGAFDTTYATINTANNYRYDEIGNLIADSTEEIDSIKWTVYGKIKEIKRTSGSSKKNLKFDYDASGNRIAKHVLNSSNTWENTTYYTRDAQGNVMSIYKQEMIDSSMSFKLNEQHLYGSSRLGMTNPYKEMIAADTTNEFVFDTLNKKQYEFSNHLGNVLAVISDRKIALDTNSDNYMDYMQADILSSTDYYPFGSPMPGRSFVGSNGYRYGFNGKEKDDEAKGANNSYDFGNRIFDPRLGRFLTLDRFSSEFADFSPYLYAANSPIISIDIKGDSAYRFNAQGKFISKVADGNDFWSVEIARTNKQGQFLNVMASVPLNDQENDPANMEYLTQKYGNTATIIHIKTEKDVKGLMEKSGVTSEFPRNNKWVYAGLTGHQEMDYWSTYLTTESENGGLAQQDAYSDKGGGFFIFIGTNKAYNSMDGGNYLWGAGMKNLGFSEGQAKIGAHGNQYLFGHPDTGMFDAPSDQQAISDAFKAVSIYPTKKQSENKTKTSNNDNKVSFK